MPCLSVQVNPKLQYVVVPGPVPGIEFMEGGVKAAAAGFPANQQVICTYSKTLNQYALVRRDPSLVRSPQRSPAQPHAKHPAEPPVRQ